MLIISFTMGSPFFDGLSGMRSLCKILAVPALVGFTLTMLGCGEQQPPTTEREKGKATASSKPEVLTEVVKTNADIAFAVYSDSLHAAKKLQAAVDQLIAQPSEQTLNAAREAWLAAREPYGLSEVYRFRGGPVDTLKDDGTLGSEGDGPEGRINAWPLGEALIDYVATEVDGLAGPEVADSVSTINGNIIADSAKFPEITTQLLIANQELGGDERNVTSGYHAVEFLLWGQDLNSDGSGAGPRDASAGQRPFTDYSATEGECTSGKQTSPSEICQRRAQYLKAAASLLVADLQRIADAWDPNGPLGYPTAYIQAGEASLAGMIESMGRLSFGELAGERMNIALLDDSQEDEHSCFSDNTHRDIYLNFVGIANTFDGHYTRIDGSKLSGPGIDELLIAMGETDLEKRLRHALADTQEKIARIDAHAKAGVPFDQQIQREEYRKDIAAAIAALSAQTRVIEEVARTLKLSVDDLRQDTEQNI